MALGFGIVVGVLLVAIGYFALASTALDWLQKTAAWCSISFGLQLNSTEVALVAVCVSGFITLLVLGFFWKRYTQDFSF